MIAFVPDTADHHNTAEYMMTAKEFIRAFDPMIMAGRNEAAPILIPVTDRYEAHQDIISIQIETAAEKAEGW